MPASTAQLISELGVDDTMVNLKIILTRLLASVGSTPFDYGPGVDGAIAFLAGFPVAAPRITFATNLVLSGTARMRPTTGGLPLILFANGSISTVGGQAVFECPGGAGQAGSDGDSGSTGGPGGVTTFSGGNGGLGGAGGAIGVNSGSPGLPATGHVQLIQGPSQTGYISTPGGNGGPAAAGGGGGIGSPDDGLHGYYAPFNDSPANLFVLASAGPYGGQGGGSGGGGGANAAGAGGGGGGGGSGGGVIILAAPTVSLAPGTNLNNAPCMLTGSIGGDGGAGAVAGGGGGGGGSGGNGGFLLVIAETFVGLATAMNARGGPSGLGGVAQDGLSSDGAFGQPGSTGEGWWFQPSTRTWTQLASV